MAETQEALMAKLTNLNARQEATNAHLDTMIADFDRMIAQTKGLPSWPKMARQIQHLAQLVVMLTARVEALEQECTALRQGELLRLWGDNDTGL